MDRNTSDTRNPDWESAARTYVGRYIEEEANRQRKRIHEISSTLQDGDDLSVEAIDESWMAALTHHDSIGRALAHVVSDDTQPEPTLNGDAFELFQLLSQVIWTRRSATQELREELILDVRERLEDMDRLLADISDEELERSTDDRR